MWVRGKEEGGVKDDNQIFDMGKWVDGKWWYFLLNLGKQGRIQVQGEMYLDLVLLSLKYLEN